MPKDGMRSSEMSCLAGVSQSLVLRPSSNSIHDSMPRNNKLFNSRCQPEIWPSFMARRARETNVVTQMGNQGHAEEGARLINEWVADGVLGQVREVHCWTNRPVWPQGIPRPEGSDPVPAYKEAMEFRHVKDKFRRAGLTEIPSEVVSPPRVAECPVQLEGQVMNVHQVGKSEDHSSAVEVRVVRTHVHESILGPGHRHHLDPDKWRPLIMSFLQFYGLGNRVHPSRLADVF